AGVGEGVAGAGRAEDGRPVRGHRPKARAVLAPVVVGGVREEVAGELQDVVEVARGPAPVVAGELRGRREAQPIAQARPADEPLLVAPADPRRWAGAL